MSIAVITGASSGLGVCYINAVTKLFPQIDELWLIARREERLKEVAKKYPEKISRKTHGNYSYGYG